ncbi:MAG: MerR family transcriptional regulator [Defluviimonas sp.]|nr:MerR family transcriptional regulator [Defluviimonas sp.]
MAEHGRIRRGDFATFAGVTADVIKMRRRSGMLPFGSTETGQRTYGPVDILAWQLQDALTAQGMSARTAALSVLASRAADTFLNALALGHDVSDLHLVAWREGEDGCDGREVNHRAATMTGDELTELRLDRPQPDRTWHRLDKDGTVTAVRHARPLGLVSLIAVPIARQWRIAIERARAAGLDLLPGSVAALERARDE